MPSRQRDLGTTELLLEIVDAWISFRIDPLEIVNAAAICQGPLDRGPLGRLSDSLGLVAAERSTPEEVG